MLLNGMFFVVIVVMVGVMILVSVCVLSLGVKMSVGL